MDQENVITEPVLTQFKDQMLREFKDEFANMTDDFYRPDNSFFKTTGITELLKAMHDKIIVKYEVMHDGALDTDDSFNLKVKVRNSSPPRSARYPLEAVYFKNVKIEVCKTEYARLAMEENCVEDIVNIDPSLHYRVREFPMVATGRIDALNIENVADIKVHFEIDWERMAKFTITKDAMHEIVQD